MAFKTKCSRCGNSNEFIEEQSGMWYHCSRCTAPIYVSANSMLHIRRLTVLLIILGVLAVVLSAVVLIEPNALEPLKESWKVIKNLFTKSRR